MNNEDLYEELEEETVNIPSILSRRKDNNHQNKRRSENQVSDLIQELMDRVWYYRAYVHQINDLPDMETEERIDYLQRTQASREKTEKLYGKESLAPLDDWNLGYLNGYLAAIRWMSGEEHNSTYI